MKDRLPAAEFKARCLEILDRVAAGGASVVITKRGKPVARVAPLVDKPGRIVGALRGEIESVGDIVSPLDVIWPATKR
jgi:prevent-host-death family protein